MANQNVSSRATLVNLSASAWGQHKSDSEVTEEVLVKHEAEKHSGSFKKRLLNKRATAGIRSVKSAARTFHNHMTLPWLEDGTRILANVNHIDYVSKIGEHINIFNQAVDEFIKEYPNHVKIAKKELGKLFDEKDYPDPKVVRSKYKLRTVFLPWPKKEDFRGDIDPNIIKEIGDNLDARLEEILKGSMSNIAERIVEVVGHMSERLKKYKPGDSNGNKAEGKFHDSMVHHVRDLASLLPGFNLTDNPKITAITKTIQEKLAIHDPDVLRDVIKVRKQVIKDADDVLKKAKEFLT